MSLRISTNIFDNTISWDQYYGPLMYDEHKADTRLRIDRLLQNINIESKLYNLMSNLASDLTWVVIIFDECTDAIDFLTIIYAAASCSDRINVQIYLDRSSSPLTVPKAVLICFKKGDMLETGSWGAPSALWSLPEADKILAVQEKLIDLVKVWNE